MPVQFDYTLATDAPADLTGSIALTLEVTDIRGWRRTIELQPESAFEGASASVSGVIDLVALRAMIDDLEASTGLRRDSYGVTVVPTVTVAGTVAGVAIAERFSPPLEFRLDAVQLYFTPTPGPASATPADALTPVAAGSVDVERTVPATVTALGREYAVTTLTHVGMIGGATAAGGALVVGLLMLFAQRADEATKIRSRYGALMVDADVDGVGEGYTVELKRCEDLVRVAERLGVPIMHVERAGEHWYLLRDADTLYRYRIAADQSEAEPKPPVRPAQVGADAGVHAGYPRVVSWPDLVEAGGDAL